MAWPYAVYCATRYLRDVDAAYDLMDAAVDNTEEYYIRFNGARNSVQLFYRIVSVLKRLSKQRAWNNREIASGTLSDLEILAGKLSSKPQLEQNAYVRQILAEMSERSRKITVWRLEGHTWRQIAQVLNANYTTVRRTYHKELRALLFPSSDSHGSSSAGED